LPRASRPEGRFFDPIPHMGGGTPLYIPAKLAILFSKGARGARPPGQPVAAHRAPSANSPTDQHPPGFYLVRRSAAGKEARAARRWEGVAHKPKGLAAPHTEVHWVLEVALFLFLCLDGWRAPSANSPTDQHPPGFYLVRRSAAGKEARAARRWEGAAHKPKGLAEPHTEVHWVLEVALFLFLCLGGW
jgi:hypothetical protein